MNPEYKSDDQPLISSSEIITSAVIVLGAIVAAVIIPFTHRFVARIFWYVISTNG